MWIIDTNINSETIAYIIKLVLNLGFLPNNPKILKRITHKNIAYVLRPKNPRKNEFIKLKILKSRFISNKEKVINKLILSLKEISRFLIFVWDDLFENTGKFYPNN